MVIPRDDVLSLGKTSFCKVVVRLYKRRDSFQHTRNVWFEKKREVLLSEGRFVKLL
jgi:hypothetical protein